MRSIALRWLILTCSILLASYFIEDIHIKGFLSAFCAAAILGILNTFFRPIALLLTLPLNVMTFGLFTFVINAIMLKMASGVIDGFEVHGFWSAVFGAFIISIVNWLTDLFFRDDKKIIKKDQDVIDLEHKGEDRWE